MHTFSYNWYSLQAVKVTTPDSDVVRLTNHTQSAMVTVSLTNKYTIHNGNSLTNP